VPGAGRRTLGAGRGPVPPGQRRQLLSRMTVLPPVEPQPRV